MNSQLVSRTTSTLVRSQPLLAVRRVVTPPLAIARAASALALAAGLLLVSSSLPAQQALNGVVELMDQNQDKRLTRREIPLPFRQRFLSALDADGDGILSTQELMAIGQGGAKIDRDTPIRDTAESTVIRSARNVDYVKGKTYEAGWGQLDFHAPQGQWGVPTVIVFHSGGLYSGDKSSLQAIANRLVGEGYAVAAPNYRMAPEFAFPAPIWDAAKAVSWLFDNLERLGGDPNRVAVMGIGAGGYLTALLCFEPGYLAAYGVKTSQITGCIAASPVLDVKDFSPFQTKLLFENEDARKVTMSPIERASYAAPPTLILHGSHELQPLIATGQKMFDAINAAGKTAAQRIVLQAPAGLEPELAQARSEPSQRTLAFLQKVGLTARPFSFRR